MVVRDDFLTNGAYGFPTRGHVRRVTPRVLAVVHITANMGSAQLQRNYANRGESPGPSAHYYIDRDGGGIHAVDERRYAAWSNGDLKSPFVANRGVAYLVGLDRQNVPGGGTYNANEGCYLEIECVGTATPAGQWTDQQFDTVAGLIADASAATGIEINVTTVLPHAYINMVDRVHCPALHVGAHMARLIALALEKAVATVTISTTVLPFGGTYVIKGNATVTGIKIDDVGRITDTKVWSPRPSDSTAHYDATVDVSSLRGNPFLRCTDGYFAGWLVSSAQVVETPNPAPPATDCASQIEAAITADRAKARIVYV